MSTSQLPLLIGLLVALAVVLVLIVRQVRAGALASNANEIAPAPVSTLPAAAPPVRQTIIVPRHPLGAAAPHKTAATASSTPMPDTSTPIKSWGYQLQDLDLAVAARSPFDLLVIDTTRDGSDDTALTAADLARLKRKPDGSRRRVLAYLSIGEAESYRSYWDKQWKRDKPAWLLGENPDWKENYAVCFWDPGWQAIMCGAPDARLDRILAAGFDGVYLDKCDVFEDLKRRYKSAAASRPDIEGDMVQFIASLSAYAKARTPGFMMVMQNAEDLLDNADLRATLDGVAKEELVYGCDKPEKLNSRDDFESSRDMLALMRTDGKLVLVVEYLNDHAKIDHAAEVLAPLGFVLYVSDKNRDLKKLNYTIVEA